MVIRELKTTAAPTGMQAQLQVIAVTPVKRGGDARAAFPHPRRTCQDYLQANNTGGANLIWMSGFLRVKSERPSLTRIAARQLGDLCRNNPTRLVIEIYRRVKPRAAKRTMVC